MKKRITLISVISLFAITLLGFGILGIAYPNFLPLRAEAEYRDYSAQSEMKLQDSSSVFVAGEQIELYLNSPSKEIPKNISDSGTIYSLNTLEDSRMKA